MKQKIISLTIAMLMLFNSIPAAFAVGGVYSDVSDSSFYAESVYRLSMLGALSGYGDGTFNPEAPVTRAEFAKIIVSAMGQQDKVVANNTAGVFSDVQKSHWANGYINYVNKTGYVMGYADGSFNPDGYITFAEALTVVVRVLGYQAADVGYHWPSNFVEKAAALGLITGISLSANDLISRGNIAVIVDRALSTNINAQAPKKLLEVAGYTELEECIIAASQKEDQSLASREIRTSAGVYKLAGELVSFTVGQRGSLYLNKDKEAIAFYPEKQFVRSIVVESVFDKEITGYEGGNMVTLKTDDNLTIYWKGQKYTLSTVSANVMQGSNIKLYGKQDGDWDYGILNDDSLRGPIVAQNDFSGAENAIGDITFGSGVRVLRNSKAVSLGDIKKFDVLYYSAASNVLFAYEDKRVGIYEEALPSKPLISKVRVSGVDYTLETKAVANKLDDSPGAYEKKDNIMLLLGRDGKVVDVVLPYKQEMVVDSVIDDTIMFYSGTGVASYKVDSAMVYYYNNQKGTFKSYASAVVQGTKVTLYGTRADDWTYAEITDDDLLGPVVLKQSPIGTDLRLGEIQIAQGARVFRNGLAVSLSELNQYDVVYYSPTTKTVMAYSEKRTGNYDKALPSKAFVSSIMLSGVEYKVETKAAISKLDESVGSFKINAKITLLLGRDNRIVDVIGANGSNVYNYGVVLGASQEISTDIDTKGQLQYKTKIFSTDGNTYEYKSDKDYSEYKGVMIEFDFQNGYMILKSSCTQSSLRGDVDQNKRTIGEIQVAKDAVILERVSNVAAGEAKVRKIDFSDIDKTELAVSDIIYYQRDAKFGDISLLYLNNISNDGYEYGILQKMNSKVEVTQHKDADGKVIGTTEKYTYTYTIAIEMKTYTYSADNRVYMIEDGTPIGALISEDKIVEMFSLMNIAVAGSIDAYDTYRIRIDGTTYPMSEDVVVYKQNSMGERIPISINELDNSKIQRVIIYADKHTSYGGKIRVIIARFD